MSGILICGLKRRIFWFLHGRAARSTPLLAPLVAQALVGGSAYADAPSVREVWAAVLAHDVRFAGGVEHGADFNGEVMWKPLVAVESGSEVLRVLLQPLPTVGAEVNTAGATSQLYAMMVWTLPFDLRRGWDDRLFANLGLGGALNNGKQEEAPADRKDLGSHVLFHLSGEVGAKISRHMDVSVYFDHSSNAGACRVNDSLNDAGLRLGWRF